MKTTGLFFIVLIFFVTACSDRLSQHEVIKSVIGTPVSSAAMVASMAKPGPIKFEKILSVEQFSRRSEQVILEDKLAAQAGIKDADETISIYFYALRHPTKGLFLIDSGMPQNYINHFGFLFKKAIGNMKLNLVQETNHWIENSAGEIIKGVFLTHLHFDHAVGVSAIPEDTPIYVGPNDGSQRDFANRLVGSPTDDALKGNAPMRELVFKPDIGGAFEGILDIFGDGSLYALHTPGHTPGSLAFLVNSIEGPQLIIGDTIRTRLEWTHGLKPTWYAKGTEAEVAITAAILRKFAAAHPKITVHLGHQPLKAATKQGGLSDS